MKKICSVIVYEFFAVFPDLIFSLTVEAKQNSGVFWISR
jgi:hypothetical protein